MRCQRILLVLMALLLLGIGTADACRVIRVLAIGNSFSEDAVEHYLYELAAAQGDSLVIGNAYIGGCSIDRHWANAQAAKPEYRYRKIVGGHTTTRKNVDLATIIRDDQWDIITLQQASHFSGLPYTYAHLQHLKDYVLATSTNPRVQIAWHLTWAYPATSTHGAFKYYGRSQQRMYSNILLTAAEVLPRVGITRVIPVGVTIQLARQEMGDVMNRDGFHLQLAYGRYAAACTWCEFLTGHSIMGNPYRPAGVDAATARLMQRMAHRALRVKI